MRIKYLEESTMGKADHKDKVSRLNLKLINQQPNCYLQRKAAIQRDYSKNLRYLRVTQNMHG